MRISRIICLLLAITTFNTANAKLVHIGTGRQFANIEAACPTLGAGDTVMVHTGTYDKYQYFAGLKGNAKDWIVITKAPNENVEIGGGWQFTSAEYIKVQNLKFKGNAKYNNTLLHFDHAGDCNKLSNYINIDSCEFLDVSAGNTFKLGGVSNFLVSNCKFVNNTSGFAGIALNESRSGVITNCYFENIQTKGIQFKLGTMDVLVQSCYFKNAGIDDSALKIGESGGKEFYCPDAKDWHAKNIKIYSNIFVGGKTPFSIGLAINSEIYNNTIVSPQNFVLRLLSDEAEYENKNNKLINNVFYLDKTIYFNGSSGAANLFFSTIFIQNNLFYASHKPTWTGPDPNGGDYDAEEIKGVQFINNKIANPLFTDLPKANYKLLANSPALKSGLKLIEPTKDYFGKPFKAERTIGAIESDSIETIIKVTGIQLDRDTIELIIKSTEIRDSIQLKATILPTNAANKQITWQSRDTNVAKVSQNGLVLPIGFKDGITIIDVTSADGSFSDSCFVIVTKFLDNVEMENTTQFSIYPNPVQNELLLNLESDLGYKLEIQNLIGEIIYTAENTNKLSLGTMPSGLYLLKLTQGKSVYWRKLVKE